jgi:hypothetical protein
MLESYTNLWAVTFLYCTILLFLMAVGRRLVNFIKLTGEAIYF